MFLLIAALAIQSPFTSMRAYSKEVVCPDRVTLGLWNAVNELAGAIPGIDTLSKLAIQGSKVFQKETGNSCAMNMENLLRTQAADHRADFWYYKGSARVPAFFTPRPG